MSELLVGEPVLSPEEYHALEKAVRAERLASRGRRLDDLVPFAQVAAGVTALVALAFSFRRCRECRP